MRPTLAALAAILSAAVAVSGCSGPTPPSPVASIPKITVDYIDNMTSIFLTSLNADLRYENITVVLRNENLSAPLVFHEHNGFALVGHTGLTYFVLNASANTDSRHYFYNATMHIAANSPVGAPLTYQILIQESGNGQSQPESLPFRRALAEV